MIVKAENPVNFSEVMKKVYGLMLGASSKSYYAKFPTFAPCLLSDGVTGNTSDFGSEESRFEPWSDNNPENIHQHQ